MLKHCTHAYMPYAHKPCVVTHIPLNALHPGLPGLLAELLYAYSLAHQQGFTALAIWLLSILVV